MSEIEDRNKIKWIPNEGATPMYTNNWTIYLHDWSYNFEKYYTCVEFDGDTIA
jgi:hypothetical protein